MIDWKLRSLILGKIGPPIILPPSLATVEPKAVGFINNLKNTISLNLFNLIFGWVLSKDYAEQIEVGGALEIVDEEHGFELNFDKRRKKDNIQSSKISGSALSFIEGKAYFMEWPHQGHTEVQHQFTTTRGSRRVT
ncbi:hypothetical protein EW145_g4014 [Phellinidium pouzarii]|uniref:Uncharacterized protein n=1 Tax=Phellinidium pouzarii TaxID=167371 RepID=A0A4S4L592_9AGAM|nr:hypothetical protein EW145_g4014 [Phellinidium pouzarii]